MSKISGEDEGHRVSFKWHQTITESDLANLYSFLFSPTRMFSRRGLLISEGRQREVSLRETVAGMEYM